MTERHIPSFRSYRVRAVVVGLGATVLIGAYAKPQIEPILREFSISENIDEYPFKIKFSDEVCYSKDRPTLSDALQQATIYDAYCPTVIDGKTKFIKITIPTKEITNPKTFK